MVIVILVWWKDEFLTLSTERVTLGRMSTERVILRARLRWNSYIWNDYRRLRRRSSGPSFLEKARWAFNAILTNRDLICIGGSRTITSHLFHGRLEFNHINSTPSSTLNNWTVSAARSGCWWIQASNTAEPNKDSTTATESQLHRVYLVSINCWLDSYRFCNCYVSLIQIETLDHHEKSTKATHRHHSVLKQDSWCT